MSLFLRRNRRAGITRGRQVYLTKFLGDLFHGTGVCQIAASVFAAENCLVTFLSTDSNQEGLDQAIPVLRRQGVTDIHIAHCPGPLHQTHWHALHAKHPVMWIAPLDHGLVLHNPALCDYGTVRWSLEKGFRTIYGLPAYM